MPHTIRPSAAHAKPSARTTSVTLFDRAAETAHEAIVGFVVEPAEPDVGLMSDLLRVTMVDCGERPELNDDADVGEAIEIALNEAGHGDVVVHFGAAVAA